MKANRLRIAVVDDEESIRKALKRLMNSAGMDVDTYPSGVELFDALPACKPDCIVLDLHMPVMNGFEVQDRLMQSGARLPVVVITGHDTPESRARAMAGGADAYLLKPIDDQVLIKAVVDAIAHFGH